MINWTARPTNWIDVDTHKPAIPINRLKTSTLNSVVLCVGTRSASRVDLLLVQSTSHGTQANLIIRTGFVYVSSIPAVTSQPCSAWSSVCSLFVMLVNLKVLYCNLIFVFQYLEPKHKVESDAVAIAVSLLTLHNKIYF